MQQSVHRVDRRDHIAETKMVAQHWLRHHRSKDRHGIGEARSLDDKAAKWKNLAALAFGVEVEYGGAEIAADGAAQTAALQQHDFVVEPSQQMVIEAHFAEFVHQHSGIRKLRRRAADAATASFYRYRGSR